MNSVTFLSASFETASLNLGYSTYQLAKYPYIQKKITKRN